MANDYAAVVLPAAARTRGISISNGTDHTPSTGAAPPPPPPYLDNSPAKPKRRSSMEEKLDGGIQPSGNRNLPPRPKGAPIYSTTTAIPSMFDCFPSLPVRRSSRHTQQSGSTNTTQSQKRAFPRFSTMLSKTGPVIPPLPDGLAIATRHSTKSRAETVSNIDPDDDAAPLCPKRRSSAEDGSAARYEKNQAALTNKSQSTLPPFFAIVEEEIKRLSSLTFGSDNAARCTSSAPSSPKAAQEDASFPNESAHTTKSVLGNSLTAALEAWGKLDEIRSSFSDKPQKQQAEEEEEHPVLAANTRWAKLRGAQKWITGAKQKTEQSFIQRRFGKKPAWKLREEAKAAIHPSIIKKVPEEDQEYELADLVAPEPVGNNDPFTYQTAFLSTSSLDISLSTDAC
uniref:Uncharacterized protein n=1 Tax=Craspedostauros australis TaxID=1486917 RepID=A0A7R9WUY5_9STRA|mmetsp:Transcript_19165/g.53235  ORF Transcript_19165/g.53235 Transcript_19165/m.53235 type:complete len:398 (+) Transcript_19165:1-1194(+)